MSHMDYTGSGATCADSGCGSRVVSYTATGAEGTDFNVSIGATLAADDYNVFFSPAGVTNLPVLDLPTALAGDRTTSTFRVTTADVLTVGDVLKFLIVE
jgi:positive regulator of sigma E activity